jgi:hypothetical protein
MKVKQLKRLLNESDDEADVEIAFDSETKSASFPVCHVEDTVVTADHPDGVVLLHWQN